MSDQAGDQVREQVNGTDIQRNDRTIKAETEQAREQVSEQAGEQVQMLVNAIREDTVTMFMIQKRLNNASRSFIQMKMLKPAIAQGYGPASIPRQAEPPQTALLSFRERFETRKMMLSLIVPVLKETQRMTQRNLLKIKCMG